MTLIPTSRDLEVARALCHCVRYFSLRQVRTCWWENCSERAGGMEARIRKLVENGWLGKATVLAKPIPILDGPIYCWSPGDLEPNFGKAAWKAQSRWTLPAKSTTIIYAGRKATHNYLGTRPRKVKQIFQVTHDLGLAEVYLLTRRLRPELARSWVGEGKHRFKKPRMKNADAYIFPEDTWPPKLIIEFAGCYPKKRIEQFHAFCVKQHLSYELW